jgi:hypothetical protein
VFARHCADELTLGEGKLMDKQFTRRAVLKSAPVAVFADSGWYEDQGGHRYTPIRMLDGG